MSYNKLQMPVFKEVMDIFDLDIIEGGNCTLVYM